MGVCQSQNQSESFEKGNIKGNGKGIPVIHPLIQPIIHEDTQPIITENITPIIRKIIIPVFVRNEMELQNIPEDLILNHPDVVKQMAHLPEENIEGNEQPPIGPPPMGQPPIGPPPMGQPPIRPPSIEQPSNGEKIPGNLPQENEPVLVKVVGQLHHYIKLEERHITKKIVQPIIQDRIQPVIQTVIQPIIYP